MKFKIFSAEQAYKVPCKNTLRSLLKDIKHESNDMNFHIGDRVIVTNTFSILTYFEGATGVITDKHTNLRDTVFRVTFDNPIYGRSLEDLENGCDPHRNSYWLPSRILKHIDKEDCRDA